VVAVIMRDGRTVYSAITSLDGYVEDEDGRFDWAAPDDEVLGFLNELERPIGTYLYGRRMYETMIYWETADLVPDESPLLPLTPSEPAWSTDANCS
jgi:dihydrofolate reductase